MAHKKAGIARQRKLEERSTREEKALKILNQHNKKLRSEPKIRTKRKAPEEIILLLPKEVRDGWLSFKIRNPELWYSKSYNLDRQIRDFARWIFCEYTVPPFMFELFKTTKRNTTSIFNNKEEFNLFMSWFITIAQGHSFAKAVKGLFTKKEAHLFLNAPNNQSIKENIWWVRCKSRDISESFTSFIVSRFVHRAHQDQFWMTLLDFVKKNEEELNVETLQEILDFLPAQRARDQNFSLKGRTLNSLIQLSNEWHREQQVTKHGKFQQWDGLNIEDWKYENKQDKVTWIVYQLHNSKELYSEGRRMRHCVYSYVNACVSGHSGIFTMEYKDSIGQYEKCLTIEVRGKRIVQAKGRLNRKPTGAELNALHRWSLDRQLVIDNWIVRL